ncbi:MAG: hypothetical protein WED10_02610 [Brumimicrobium sp.]
MDKGTSQNLFVARIFATKIVTQSIYAKKSHMKQQTPTFILQTSTQKQDLS